MLGKVASRTRLPNIPLPKPEKRAKKPPNSSPKPVFGSIWRLFENQKIRLNRVCFNTLTPFNPFIFLIFRANRMMVGEFFQRSFFHLQQAPDFYV